VEILKPLRETLYKRPHFWPNDWILHHGNAPAHRTLTFKQLLAQKPMTEMEHQPYSPDFVPNDFWLFLKTKSALKG
jgi:hypothetical protein